jgi:hypothetical protein
VDGPGYPVGFVATLAYPYFVELSVPEYLNGKPQTGGGAWGQFQPELLPAW